MCRSSLHPFYKDPMACFKCRKVWHDVPCCPECKGEVHNMGKDFKAPRQANRRQWRKVELLFKNGIRYASCGCGGPGYRPQTLPEARDLVRGLKVTPEDILRRHNRRYWGWYDG